MTHKQKIDICWKVWANLKLGKFCSKHEIIFAEWIIRNESCLWKGTEEYFFTGSILRMLQNKMWKVLHFCSSQKTSFLTVYFVALQIIFSIILQTVQILFKYGETVYSN